MRRRERMIHIRVSNETRELLSDLCRRERTATGAGRPWRNDAGAGRQVDWARSLRRR